MKTVILNNGVTMPILGFGVFQISWYYPSTSGRRAVWNYSDHFVSCGLLWGSWYQSSTTRSRCFSENDSSYPGFIVLSNHFLGYPIWAMDLPRFMYPFLQQQNFSNKIIAPFCTSTMSGISSTENALQQLCSNTRILNGLTIQGGERGQNLFILWQF